MRCKRQVKIHNDLGVHLRAAGVLAQEASRYESEVWVEHSGGRANAKSIMGILTLAAHKGIELTVVAEGADAERAVQGVVGVIEGGFKSI